MAQVSRLGQWQYPVQRPLLAQGLLAKSCVG